MNVRIDSDFQFSVKSLQYSPTGDLSITLASKHSSSDSHYQYSANFGDGQAEEKPSVSLVQYVKDYADTAHIKPKTKDSYRLMRRHLAAYGDSSIDQVTTAYLQGFLSYLQDQGIQVGTQRLYFQKLACVLHEAYRNGLFDDRILQRVKRPKRDQGKKGFLTETELKRLTKHRMDDKCSNIQSMFLFSCLTGLRFGDVQSLRWDEIRRNGKHLTLEFHQQKTDTQERLPLCEEAEAMLRSQKRCGEYVFQKESNQRTNIVLKRWCQKAKVKKRVTFHCARHTFCVLLLANDVPIYTVQRLMCHSDIGTTNVYADLLNKNKAKAVKRLPAIA